MPPHGQQQRQQQQRRGSAVLRLATHNVRGLACHIEELAATWVGLRLDVVVVQETYVSSLAQGLTVQRDLTAACRAVQPCHPGFHPLWCHNTAEGAGRSAGTAILVMGDLHSSGLVTVDAQRVRAQQQGRQLVAPIKWGGHSIRLVAVHLPNDGEDQRTFIAQYLQPAMQPHGDCLLGGDFNFVEATTQDRVSAVAADLGPEQPLSARRLHEKVPGLVDLYRQQHPHRRSYTHHQGPSAARLDRWYGRGGITSYVMQCHVHDQTPSDHRPVVLQLAARQGARQGPGLPGARLHQVMTDAAAKQHLEQYILQSAAAAPQDDAALLDWWGGWKVGVLHEVVTSAREVRLRQEATDVQARRLAALALTTAFAAVETATTQAAAAAALQQAGICNTRYAGARYAVRGTLVR